MSNDFNNVKVKVLIGGKACDFSYVRLHQTMYGHHTFHIELNYIKYKDLYDKKTTWDKHPEEYMQELLGTEVSINMSETGGASNEFIGYIKNAKIKGRSSGQATVSIQGGDPTVFMTDDYTMESFIDYDVASIVLQTLMDLNIKIDHDLNPIYKHDIPFVYRYKESSYDFLRRLLASTGDAFYYDGKKIIVGPPKKPEKYSKGTENDVNMSYKYDMLEMDICSGLTNHAIEQYDYDPGSNKIGDPEFPGNHLSDRLTNVAIKKGEEIYKKISILPGRMANRSSETYSMMREGLVNEHYAKLADQTYIKAKTKTCKAGLAKVMKMVSDPDMFDKYYSNLGRYRIVDILHTYDETKGEYKNEFIAVNAKTNYFPIRDAKYPTAMPEVAKVVDNADPKNMGRVKVQFVWQQLTDRPSGKTSGWMRVQTPDAGSSDTVAQNRGFFFVPEVGDQVMVGYELGDPNRPYVAGSLFHCNNTQGTEQDNSVKTIITKSGHTLEFNDASANMGITIKDKNGNCIHLDTSGKSIVISAQDKISLISNDIELMAKNDLTFISKKNTNHQVGADFAHSIGGEHTLMIGKNSSTSIAANAKCSIEKDLLLNVGAKLNLMSNEEMVISSGDSITIKGQSDVSLESGTNVFIAE